MTTAERIKSTVIVDDRGCWIWQGSTNRSGYGRVYYDGATRIAHRVSYQLFVGPIPDGLGLDHLCRVRACVNPRHLEPVTIKTNLERSPLTNGSRTHCPSGHAYTEENTYRWRRSRYCRACRRAADKVRAKARKVKAA